MICVKLALPDMRLAVAGCFVAVNDERASINSDTLAATSVSIDALADLTKRLPRYPLKPAVLMGRLALATEYQGCGLGRALIFDAAMRTDRLGILAFAIIVDAKDDRVVAFYQSNGFARYGANPGGCLCRSRRRRERVAIEIGKA